MQRDGSWAGAPAREEGSAVLLRGVVGGLVAAVAGWRIARAAAASREEA